MNWKETYDREAPVLFSYLLAKGCPPHLAEDLVQDVFLSAMSTGNEIAKPRAYLFKGARNALARQRRPSERPDAVVPVVDPASGADEAEAVNRAMMRLPDEQREVVVLRVWQNMSFREIGEALDIPADTAASRWRYGIAKLRSILERSRKPCEKQECGCRPGNGDVRRSGGPGTCA